MAGWIYSLVLLRYQNHVQTISFVVQWYPSQSLEYSEANLIKTYKKLNVSIDIVTDFKILKFLIRNGSYIEMISHENFNTLGDHIGDNHIVIAESQQTFQKK